MTALIKAMSGGAQVRPIGGRTPPPAAEPSASDPERRALKDALAAAEVEVVRLGAALKAATDAVPEIEREAGRAGREEGLKAAQDDAERRAGRIAAGMDAALRAWDDRLGEVDALAVMLARTALAKMFDDSADLADLVVRTIRLHLCNVRQESVVAIRVSKSDFADEEARATLALKCGAGAIDLVFDPVLASGECRIDLQLGSMEIGVGTQARELDAFLEKLGNVEVGT